MSNIITKDSDEFKELAGWMTRTEKAVESTKRRQRPTIADEHYMNSEQVCEKLHISKRTLQALRDTKSIPYTSICGRYLYPESGLHELLKRNYRDFKAWNK